MQWDYWDNISADYLSDVNGLYINNTQRKEALQPLFFVY